MDYESKYNELVKAVRVVVEANPGLCKIDEGLGCLSKLLPEKESEDEGIREEIIQFFKDASIGKTRVIASETFVKWAEFFEKQKEQKPIISDEAIRDGVAHFGITQYQIDYWLKKHINVVGQQPVGWSEKDKNNLNRIAEILVEGSNVQNWWCKERLISKDEMQELTDWLKCLQPRWKPSEEQMDALRKATYRMGNSCFGKSAANDENLHSLYIALEKLL